MPADSQKIMPKTMSLHNINSDYEYYRFLVAIAGHPQEDTPIGSVIADSPIAVAYTDQEYDMIHATLEKMGKSHYHVSKSSSQEPDHIQKTSPVRTFTDPTAEYGYESKKKAKKK